MSYAVTIGFYDEDDNGNLSDSHYSRACDLPTAIRCAMTGFHRTAKFRVLAKAISDEGHSHASLPRSEQHLLSAIDEYLEHVTNREAAQCPQ